MVEGKGRKEKRKKKRKGKKGKKQLEKNGKRIGIVKSPGSVTDAEYFRKIPESPKIQVSQNDPQKFLKIKNIILRIMVKSVGPQAHHSSFDDDQLM